VPLAADYPFLDIIWTMIVLFAWVIWFWMLLQVLMDVFRRSDISGGKKAVWTLFVIFLPFLGVLVYIVSQGEGMAERKAKEIQVAQSQMDDYVKSVAGTGGGAAAEIEKAQSLRASGAITEAEFEELKRKALA
jgi:hypothetical protein